MNRTISRFGLTGLVIVAGGGIYAHAQTATTGAITGTLRDTSGSPIAGATVRAVSPQVTRTAVSGPDGVYRLGLLNPGAWQITASMAGFATVNQQVGVGTNSTATLNLKMPKEGSTTVVVTAASSSIDQTTSQTGATLNFGELASIPKGRTFNDVVFLSPGTVSSGFGNNPSIGGGSAAENTYILDGLDTTDNRRGFQGIGLVTDFIDQLEVQTGGFKPEFSALGGVVNAVTKSGSNEFKGSAWGTWDALGIQAVPKSGEFFTAAGASSRYDAGFQVGGALIKDKLFYFVGLDLQKVEAPDAPANKYPGLKSSKNTIDSSSFVGKINWFINQDQQLTLSSVYNLSEDKQDTRYPSYGTANFGNKSKSTSIAFSATYDWNITSTLLLSIKGGITNLKTTDNPSNATDPRVIDNHYFGGPVGTRPAGPGFATRPDLYGNGFNSGGYDIYAVEDSNKTKQLKADLSYFWGDHNLKFGVGYLETTYALNDQQSGGYRYSVNASASNIYKQANSTNASVKAIYNQYYAQDTWEMTPGFRLSYGLRFETQKQEDFQGKTFMKFDNFKDYAQPRLGFTWDINNDGKSKLSANYGSYFERIPQRVAIRVYANEVFLRQYFTSSSGRFVYNGNAANHYGTISGAPNLTADFATPFSFDPIAEGTKLPQRQEYIVGYDRTLDNGLTAGVHAKHRILKDPIEDSVITDKFGNYTDPGASSGAFGFFGQAILWNPGRSAAWTSRPTSGTPNTRFTTNNSLYDKAGNTYDSVDLTLDHKTSHSLTGFSYTWSRLEGNYEGVVSSSNGQADGNITASFDYYPFSGFGPMPLDRTHVMKLYGSYRFDLGKNALNIGYNWTYQSGSPISLLDDGSTTNGYIPGWDTNHVAYTSGTSPTGNPVAVNTDAAFNNPANYDVNGLWIGPMSDTHAFLDVGGYGNAIFANGQQGQYGRTPALNKVDVHIDYVMNLGGRLRLTPGVDIFNFFNTRTATGVFQLATTQGADRQANYGSPNGFQAGRSFRFSVKFQF